MKKNSKHITRRDKLHGNQNAVAGTFFTDGGNRSAPPTLNHTLNKLTHSIQQYAKQSLRDTQYSKIE